MLVAAAALALCAGACTARRIVPPAFVPERPADPGDYSAIDAYLRDFQATGGKADQAGAADQIRDDFLVALRQTNQFHSVTDLQGSAARPGGNALVLDAYIRAEHSAYRTWILDLPGIYPASGFWPLTPQWGTAKVTLRVSATAPAGKVVWSTEQHAESSYWILFYGWYRTTPVEEAYAEAYAQAFESALLALAAEDEKVIAALGPLSPAPQDGLAAATAAYTATRAPRAASAAPLPDEAKPKRFLPSGLTLLVAPLAGIGVAGDDATIITEQVRHSVQETSRFTVVSPEEMANVNEELERQLAEGCDSTSCIADVGGALGAHRLITGTVGRIGGSFTLTLKLIDIAQVRTESTATVRCRDCAIDDLLDQCQGAVNRLVQDSLGSR